MNPVETLKWLHILLHLTGFGDTTLVGVYFTIAKGSLLFHLHQLFVVIISKFARTAMSYRRLYISRIRHTIVIRNGTRLFRTRKLPGQDSKGSPLLPFTRIAPNRNEEKPDGQIPLKLWITFLRHTSSTQLLARRTSQLIREFYSRL
jgi:hypothetical protein